MTESKENRQLRKSSQTNVSFVKNNLFLYHITERQKDRKTERQKDRKTEERNIERQADRQTKRQ
jgi:hypothetical protein